MNPNGYLFYSIYSVTGTVDPFLGTGEVVVNDLCFALHGFALSSVQLVQIWMYERGQQGNVNIYVIAFMLFLNSCVLTSYFYEVSGHPIVNLHWDTFLIMGYGKCAITFIKY